MMMMMVARRGDHFQEEGKASQDSLFELCV